LKSFNREKSIRRAESREKMLSKIAVLDKPSEAKTDMELLLSPRVISGNDVLSVKELSKSFDRNVLFDDLSFQCRRGEHIAIIGDNGTGKTTILKIINKILAPDKGEVQLGSQVSIGYYDQEHHVLHMEKSIYDEIADDYPSLTITEIRNVLAAFLFTGDDVFKLIQECSGGERGRISLAKLMLSEANFLILDEPTNHLDIESKEILENALNQYDGTILYVSHDRYFINRTAHRILELSDHKIVNYLGNYDYYLEKKADAAAHQKSADEGSDLNNSKEDSDFSDSENKMDWKLQKEEQAKLRKNQNDLKKTEEKIEQLEKRDQEIEQEMTLDSVCRDVSKLSKLTSEQEALQKELTLLYEKWEELSENV